MIPILLLLELLSYPYSCVGGSQLNAVISMNGAGPLPDPMLKVTNVLVSAPAGAGIYFSNAAFVAGSQGLQIDDQADSMIAMPAMALGSVPPGTTSGSANPAMREIKVVENANIFDNLTKIMRKHTIKVGITSNWYEKFENAAGNNTGTFSFATTPRPAGSAATTTM